MFSSAFFCQRARTDRQVNAQSEKRVWDVNKSGAAYAKGCAYDFETRRAVVDMHARRLSRDDIAATLGVSRAWVNKVIQVSSTGASICEQTASVE